MGNTIIKITEEQKNYTTELLKTWAGSADTTFDATSTKRFMGILSQIAILDHLGYPRPTDLSKPDKGIDFTTNISTVDIKTKSMQDQREKSYYLNRVSLANIQMYKANIYLFANYNFFHEDIELLGWITKEDLLTKGTFYDVGDECDGYSQKFANYKIATSQLNKIETFKY